MSNTFRIELLPLGKTIDVEPGTGLQDLLFGYGVEFPCGGRGRCKGCKVKVLSGRLPVTAEDRVKLSAAELDQGWRLACRARVDSDLKLDLQQWEATILSDDSQFDFTPQDGLGIAIDLGTTTLVAQALDLQTGRVLAVRTALNCQAQHGADIMSRVEFSVAGQRQGQLAVMIREQIGNLITELLEDAAGPGFGARDKAALKKVVLVGNTVMHHLFCGIDTEPLSHFPFEPQDAGLRLFGAGDLGWDLPPASRIAFLPCLGGFVGSDILAGVLATKLHEHNSPPVALLDLGTNGEIVVGNKDRILCASTAAGPAFEGARISMGMRAATGAISEVRIENGALKCHVLGNAKPRGICGSGLVDAVAAGLDLGFVQFTGRLHGRAELELAAPVVLNQWDIRELQLAKGAIAAGLRILMDQWGTSRDQLAQVYLAGAFGNYINFSSAQRIGLLDFPPEKVRPVGNTALLGAKLALFTLEQDPSYGELLKKIKHVSLHEDPAFQDTYVEEMSFPRNSD